MIGRFLLTCDLRISIVAWLRYSTGSQAIGERLASRCEALRFSVGATVIAERAQCDELYVIADGEAGVETTASGSAIVQLATIGPGALFGELAYILPTPRLASVRATTSLSVWRVSRAAPDELAQRDRAATLAFQQAQAARLAERIFGANRLVRYLPH